MALSADTHVAEAGGTSRGTRARIALQVGATLVLALAAALLVDWLTQQPALRVRTDLTLGNDNALSPATLEVLERLPLDARVDVFFSGRALERPLEALGASVQEHARRTLRLVVDASGGKVTTEEHDLSDRRNSEARAFVRMRELGLREIEPGGLLVVSAGPRTQVLHLRGDLADIDPGAPESVYQAARPPGIVNLRAEEALVSALHKVAMESSPRVLFTMGHGELDPTDPGTAGASALKQALEGDGFQTTRWDIEKQGALPPETNIVAILGPAQLFTAGELAELHRFLDAGGRVVATPSHESDADGPGSLAELLATTGMRPAMQGFLAQPIPQANGSEAVGHALCSQIVVYGDGMPAQNPVTAPLRRANRRVILPLARVVQRTDPPPGGNPLWILRTDERAWRDLGAAADPASFDWTPGPAEPNARNETFNVAMQIVYPARAAVPPERTLPNGRPETRVVCVGSTVAFSNQLFDFNRDFVLNVFNWTSAREYRVAVAAKSPQVRRVDLSQPGALARVNNVAVYLLPLLCLALGSFMAWKRRH